VKHGAVIDDKAQKTGGVAGAFLAAAFAFIKPETMIELRKHYGGNFSLAMLFIALLAFPICIAICLRTMWLRKVPIGGLSVKSHEMLSDYFLIVPNEYLDDTAMETYKSNQVDVWKGVIKERYEANRDKTRLLRYAQRVLGGGIILAMVNLALLGIAATRTAVESDNRRPSMQQKKLAEGPHLKMNSERLRELLREAGIEQEEAELLPPEKLRDLVLEAVRKPAFVHAQLENTDRLE
jgi:hypothetical protein